MEESNFVAGVEHVAGDMPEGVPTGNASSLKVSCLISLSLILEMLFSFRKFERKCKKKER